MAIHISPLAIVLLVFIAIAVIKGLAGPHTRPVVLGLLVFAVMFGVFFLFSAQKAQREEAYIQKHEALESQKEALEHEEASRPSEAPVTVTPQTDIHARHERRQRMNVLEGILQALGKVLSDRQHPVTKAVEAAHSQPPKLAIEQEKITAAEETPSWVRAAPSSQGGVDFVTIEVGPWETETECNRDLPKALQAAVADYAQRMLPLEAARRVQLPDEALDKLARERWPQHMTKEFGGTTKDMILMHVLVGFDPAMQQRIRAAAEDAIVAERLQGAGVVFAGVLGVLALLWGGLRMVK